MSDRKTRAEELLEDIIVAAERGSVMLVDEQDIPTLVWILEKIAPEPEPGTPDDAEED